MWRDKGPATPATAEEEMMNAEYNATLQLKTPAAGLVYLMGPYSSVADKAALMETVMKLACKFMLANPGTQVVTPLFYHYAVGKVDGIDSDWDFWENYSIGLMRKCDSAILLEWDGWEKSKGVHEEMRLLASMNIPIVGRFTPELKQAGRAIEAKPFINR